MGSVPLRVLHVVDSLNPGGLENGIVNVASRLAAPVGEEPGAEFEFFVSCLRERGSFAEKMPKPSAVETVGKMPGFRWSAVKRIAQQLRAIRPDLIHSHNLGPLIYSVLGSRFGKNCPIVHGEHGVFDGENSSWKRLLQRRVLYRFCKVVHVVSPSLQDQIVASGLRHRRLCSVRNGVDTERFKPSDQNKAEVRLQAGLPTELESSFLIGIVGRFGIHKGHLDLITALENLADQDDLGCDLRLVIAGDGGAARERVVERIDTSRHRSRIEWLGHCESPEKIYQALDLMVFPSTHEGLSNALLEAMACGVPVLAANACGNDEVIRDGENGWLRDLHTAEMIASRVRELTVSPAVLLDVGREARQTILNGFSLEDMADGYRSLYMLAARGGQ